MVPVNFGTQHDLESAAPAEQVAEADRVAQDAGDVPVETADTNASPDNEPEGGPFSNLGVIVLGIAGVLVLLAGVGVVLLRRS
jgi:hypothetical protein